MSKSKCKANIGVIGLSVMGSNLALNFADHGFKTAIYNRTYAVTEKVLQNTPHKNFIPAEKLEDFVASLESPRRILLMVKAGAPVDAILDQLAPLLDKGDIVMDGGNSYFRDTIRRTASMAEQGLRFLGVGISGGEEGARFGPALMPGGPLDAYQDVEHLLTAIAARAEGSDEPCCFYTSTDGAGHYVKMVHNGIEYADMQLITETYKIMKLAHGMSNSAIANAFEEWNRGMLNSYLMDITIDILREPDPQDEGELVDKILDKASQKGTGKWTNLEAVDLGVDTSVLLAGLNARLDSDLYDLRHKASGRLHGPAAIPAAKAGPADLQALSKALLLGKIICYTQGFALLKQAEQAYGWQFNFANIARIWRGGCIIRARLLPDIIQAFEAEPELNNLLLAGSLHGLISESQAGLRKTAAQALSTGISVPALTAATAYYDALRSTFSGANLIQAQRDYFGAHTFFRIDDPETAIHHEWGKH